MQGKPCKTSITPNPLFIRRGFNHSPNLSPIIGKRLNRSACRSYIKVPSGHQSPGVYFFFFFYLILENIPHEEVFRGCTIIGIFFDSCIAKRDKQIDMKSCLSVASSLNDYDNRTTGLGDRTFSRIIFEISPCATLSRDDRKGEKG